MFYGQRMRDVQEKGFLTQNSLPMLPAWGE